MFSSYPQKQEWDIALLQIRFVTFRFFISLPREFVVVRRCLVLLHLTQILRVILLAPRQLYSISQEICTRVCCALLCCGYAIVHNEFT